MARELPSPWQALKLDLTIYVVAGVGIWVATAVLTEYGATEGILVGAVAILIPTLGELQAVYRIRRAMRKIRDEIGGPTTPDVPERRVLELSFDGHPVTIRGEVRSFRVWDLALTLDGMRWTFRPHEADEAIERIQKAGY